VTCHTSIEARDAKRSPPSERAWTFNAGAT
jgi:hypothetical protein